MVEVRLRKPAARAIRVSFFMLFPFRSLISFLSQPRIQTIPQGVADSVSHAKAYKVTPVTNQLRQSIDIPLVEKLIGGQLSPKEYADTSGNQMQDAANAAGVAH